MDFGGILIYFILICVALHFIRMFLSWYKFPNISCLAVFTGDIKVGKTGVSLAFALSKYKKVHRRWRFYNFFRKIFKREEIEEPLFYSNIPVANVKYCKLTTEHILRKARFNFKSVVFVDEASLLADCYLSKTHANLSVELLKFFKLFGHETHKGYCIFNSQSLSDLHIALRKCTSQYFYIHDTNSFWFVGWCHMREERYSEDGSSINTYSSDVEDTMKTCLFWSNVFKRYDSCAYSVLTDDLPLNNISTFYGYKDSLKADALVSFRPEFANMFAEKQRRDALALEKEQQEQQVQQENDKEVVEDEKE